MNLINDAWIPAIRADGSRGKIAPWQIAETENPVVELDAPRADFQGALYQFLIGLIQTTFAPEDHDEWLAYWKTLPASDEIRALFDQFSDKFNIDDLDGPAFMQDYSLQDSKQKPIPSLLIEAPGAKTRKDNLDHFVKGQDGVCLCPACVTTALFTLQINAPSGGKGHRVGLRGGGPLTTLVMLSEADTIWHQLWANVLTQEDLDLDEEADTSTIFPWMTPTRLSDEHGRATLPGDVHPLHMYWAMPRRIRLEFRQVNSEHCMVCGEVSDIVTSYFTTKNYGYNYEGPWEHPLTPYRHDPKHKKPPLSLKGQPGGIGYRQWLGLVWQDDSNGSHAARVVQTFNEERAPEITGNTLARLWCFGYDMDRDQPMKARCWYESTMPLLFIPEKHRSRFLETVEQLLVAAKDVEDLLSTSVKSAWFSKEKLAEFRKKRTQIDVSNVVSPYWANTEVVFSALVDHLATQFNLTEKVMPIIAEKWVMTIQKEALKQFNRWVLEGEPEDLDMKRITKAKNELTKKLHTIKPIKTLKQIAASETEAA